MSRYSRDFLPLSPKSLPVSSPPRSTRNNIGVGVGVGGGGGGGGRTPNGGVNGGVSTHSATNSFDFGVATVPTASASHFHDDESGRERILDLVSQKDLDENKHPGMASLNQMAQVFRLFQPYEDNTITAENVLAFLRSKLGYRCDPSHLRSLFLDLNRRTLGMDDLSQAAASSHLGVRRAAAAVVSASASPIATAPATVGPLSPNVNVQAAAIPVNMDEKEMHLNTFIQVLRNAAAAAANDPTSSYSDHTADRLDAELDELLRTLDRMANRNRNDMSDHTGDGNDTSTIVGGKIAPGLISVASLKHRMRLCRGDKLSESEMAALIEFAGVCNRNGQPINASGNNSSSSSSMIRPALSMTGAHGRGGRDLEGFIQYKDFVHKLALNKPTGDI